MCYITLAEYTATYSTANGALQAHFKPAAVTKEAAAAGCVLRLLTLTLLVGGGCNLSVAIWC